jgi:hypothetical protein
VLKAFAEGAGAKVVPIRDFAPHYGAAVIFGWYRYDSKKAMEKRPVIDSMTGRLIVIESGFVRRGEYYQIGWNGFAGHADFRTGPGTPLDRWYKLGIDAKEWKQDKDGLIVLCGQLPRDTQVQDVDHIEWCLDTLVKLQARYGDRVRFRPHPRVKERDNPYNVYRIDPAIYDERPLQRVFNDASLIVTWNSTTATEAAIAGIPIVAMDFGSMAFPVAAHSIDAAFMRPDRTQWLAGLGYSMWTVDEMRKGLPWEHLST